MGEGFCVQPDFALFDDRLVVFEHVFDRVFERDDVAFEVVVHVFDHRGEGGGLAAAGGPGQENDAARRFGQFFADRRQAELIEGGDLAFDVPHGHGPLAAMLENVGAETPDALDVIGEIDFPLLLQAEFEMLRDNVQEDLLEPFVRGFGGIYRDQLAVDAHRHRMRNLQMDVGGMALDGRV